MVDVAGLIGLPFVYGGRGPNSFDCYGLVMHILKTEHGQAVPDVRSAASQATIAAKMAVSMPLWQQVNPAPGTVALFRIGRYISHCGYMLDELRMIHTWEQSGGVVTERIDAWKQRTVGFYRYVGN